MSEKGYNLLQAQVKPHVFGARTTSSGLLAWFLHHVWRLDPEEVEDAICDGSGDKGIDGLVMDRDLREIVVLQTKHVERHTKTQGDRALREFRGVDSYFVDVQSLDGLLASNPNTELKNLINRHSLRYLLADQDEPWTVRLVYVTDADLDGNAKGYLSATAGDSPPLDVWDRGRLSPIAGKTAAPELLKDKVKLPADSVLEATLSDTEMAIAIVPARELVKLPGIDNHTIFALNVRLSLGRTRINSELRDTIKNKDEHPLFPAYHNGLTLLTRGLEIRKNPSEIRLDGLSVVNGCQSLVTLFNNKDNITDDLKVMVKVVAVDDADLANNITYRTNNQNPVNIRDQRSTQAIQRHLHAEVEASYGAKLAYQVREGDKPSTGVDILDNQRAAQLLTAVYLHEPWNAVRKVRLFDEEYYRVFGRGVDAHRLYLLFLLDRQIEAQRDKLRGELASSFASVRFTVAHVVRQIIGLSDDGKRLFEDPATFLAADEGKVIAALEKFVGEAIDSINFHVQQDEDEAAEKKQAYDPKTVFKSREGVNNVVNSAVRDARRAAGRQPDFSFKWGSGEV